MFYILHTLKGSPFGGDTDGEDRYLTHWEQIDGGEQFTATKKFLTAMPIILFILSSFYTHYSFSHFVVNLVFMLLAVIPKLPQFHGVRLFGINKYWGAMCWIAGTLWVRVPLWDCMDSDALTEYHCWVMSRNWTTYCTEVSRGNWDTGSRVATVLLTSNWSGFCSCIVVLKWKRPALISIFANFSPQLGIELTLLHLFQFNVICATPPSVLKFIVLQVYRTAWELMVQLDASRITWPSQRLSALLACATDEPMQISTCRYLLRSIFRQ